MIRLTHEHSGAVQLKSFDEKHVRWLEGWDAAMRVVEARALLNGQSDSPNGHNQGQP